MPKRTSLSIAKRHLARVFGLRRTADLPPGVILYEGPSQIGNGGPIVAVLTFVSSNTKTTGSEDKAVRVKEWQPQVTILSTTEEPHKLVKSGNDSDVCGDCAFASGEGCYVLTFNAPLAIYRAYKRGRYPHVTPAQLERILWLASFIRLGAYGDPAAVPLWVWLALEAAAPNACRIIGYTHAWRTAPIELARWCMASTESVPDTLRARSAGWRTFRLRSSEEPLIDRERVCPAAQEAGEVLGCDTCNQCDGNRGGSRRPSRAIVAHGARATKALLAARGAA